MWGVDDACVRVFGTTPTYKMPESSSAASTPDPQVEQATKFLLHASTQQTSIADRVAFLKSKGLTATQIAAALQQAGLPDPETSTAVQGAESRGRGGRPWLTWLLGGSAAAAAVISYARTNALAARAEEAEESVAAMRGQLDDLAEVSRDLLSQQGRRLDDVESKQEALKLLKDELTTALQQDLRRTIKEELAGVTVQLEEKSAAAAAAAASAAAAAAASSAAVSTAGAVATPSPTIVALIPDDSAASELDLAAVEAGRDGGMWSEVVAEWKGEQPEGSAAVGSTTSVDAEPRTAAEPTPAPEAAAASEQGAPSAAPASGHDDVPTPSEAAHQVTSLPSSASPPSSSAPSTVMTAAAEGPSPQDVATNGSSSSVTATSGSSSSVAPPAAAAEVATSSGTHRAGNKGKGKGKAKAEAPKPKPWEVPAKSFLDKAD